MSVDDLLAMSRPLNSGKWAGAIDTVGSTLLANILSAKVIIFDNTPEPTSLHSLGLADPIASDFGLPHSSSIAQIAFGIEVLIQIIST